MNVPLIAGQPALFDKLTKYRAHLPTYGIPKHAHNFPNAQKRLMPLLKRTIDLNYSIFNFLGLGRNPQNMNPQNLSKIGKKEKG